MTLKDFFLITFSYTHDDKYANRPLIICNSGFTISAQASDYHYCSPRKKGYNFEEIEVGYPSEKCPSILNYAEDKRNPTKNIYAYVPFDLVEAIIINHGGINVEKTFSVKNLFPDYKKT